MNSLIYCFSPNLEKTSKESEDVVYFGINIPHIIHRKKEDMSQLGLSNFLQTPQMAINPSVNIFTQTDFRFLEKDKFFFRL